MGRWTSPSRCCRPAGLPDPHYHRGLLSAIGIAGIDRLVQKNVLAMSGRAAEAAGDVDVLLLDKTGTITLGNRQAVEFLPAPDIDVKELANVAQLASLADETPEDGASWFWPRNTACGDGIYMNSPRPNSSPFPPRRA